MISKLPTLQVFIAILIFLAVPTSGYDYVVIGGGPGGLTVASRLAEDDNVSVLVLEAGPNAEALEEVFVPGLIGAGQSLTTLNWAYKTTPQTHLDNRTLTVRAGKALGGGSTINSMLFPRGHKAQYDAWGLLNNDTDWSWSSLLPFFKRSEIFTPPNDFQSENGADYIPEFHGLDPSVGRVHAGFPNFFYPQSELWRQTALGLGLTATPDLTNGDPEAVGVAPNSIDPANNTRCSAVCAYWTPFSDKPNFAVLTNATVSRIIWSSEGNNGSSNLVATGVEYRLDGDTEPLIVNASREVIVAAGTIGTPKVLELSGVGNSSILSAAGIEPILDHPSVGENLADHLHSWVNAFTNFSLTTDILNQDPVFARGQLDLWYKNRTGMYSAAGGRTLGIIPPSKILPGAELDTLIDQARSNLSHFADQFSNGNKLLAKGIQAQHEIALQLYLDDEEGPLEMNLGPGYTGPTPIEQRPPRNFTTINAVFYAPLSRGRSHIASSDPQIPPLVDPAYWSHPLDVASHVAGIQFARKMMNSPPLDSILEGEFEPGTDKEKDTDVEEWLKSKATADNHPVGTMAMLPKELGGVVDTSLKIYGIENVRVVDASIIPFPISAHIMSTVYMIGEKAADIIRRDPMENCY
ncbi:hypothetical protein PM082_000478 [Marasmius tenuissimus]|nr:hypothetical protein PM082_000478 [Marasmius tenuissimus]